MKVFIVKDYDRMSKLAANVIIENVNKNPSSVLAFATGKTPLGLYKTLVRACRQREIDFSKIKAFDIDEFYSISRKDKKSYSYYLHKNLFNKINIKKSNINLLVGNPVNLKKECNDYERKIKNKADLMILGVGVNGHIAFNEPGSEKNSKTRLVKLTHIKGKGVTIGISTILSAKKIMLLASGKKKAEAISQLIKGRINKNYPVTYLKKHKDLIVIVDKEAGRDLD